MNVIFDVPQLYYLPQYMPVWQELMRRDVRTCFVFHKDPNMQRILSAVVGKEGLPAKWVENDDQAATIYSREQPDWIIFGNGTTQLNHLPKKTRTALLYHGIGVKSCYYDADLMDMDMRFVEGDYRMKELGKRYPRAKIMNVGFAKLDPLFSTHVSESIRKTTGESIGFDPESVGLTPDKPTLLYAPTFFPSSIDRMAGDWPLEFDDYNLIIKPHFFTYSKPRYRHQLKKLNQWRTFKNVYLASPEEYSLVPFMGSSDVLISEASSAFFEFAALDKPIVWCDFYKIRWNYRGPFRYRLNRRLDRDVELYRDIGAHAATYGKLKQAVDRQIHHPEDYRKKRKKYTKALLGKMDGKAAVRIVDYLLFNITC